MSLHNFDSDDDATAGDVSGAEPLPDDAVCLTCAYPLINLPEYRCPECGREFDPKLRSTYRKRSDWLLLAWIAAPPTLWECLPIVGVTLLVLLVVSNPNIRGEPDIELLCVCGSIPLLFVVTLVYLSRAIAMVFSKYVLDEHARRRSGWRWLSLPLCLIFLISSYYYPWPLYIRFWLSRSAFDRALQEVRAGTFGDSGWVGLYYVKRVETNYGTVHFICGGDANDETGFGYYGNSSFNRDHDDFWFGPWGTFQF